jgi:Multiubiquitin
MNEIESSNRDAPSEHVAESHRVTVIVNGQRREVEGDHLSYEQVVRLAFPNVDPNTAYTVTYDKGPKENREGSMDAGDKVRIQNGMVFNVSATSKS